MNPSEKKKFQKLLEKLKLEILTIIQGDSEESTSRAIDEVDRAGQMIQQQMGSMFSSNFKANLNKVEHALKKLESNTYGSCQLCGKDISLKRLSVLPLAENCIACQIKIENGDWEE